MLLIQFRRSFLAAIRVGIKELESIPLDEESDSNVKNNPINYLIDWENLFYKKIKSTNQESQEMDEIERYTDTILAKPEWQERLAKRGLALYSIINKLEKHIQNIIVISRSITWADIPGFKILIGIIKYELSARNVSTYSPQLIELLPIFINDHELINSFFYLIVKRTK